MKKTALIVAGLAISLYASAQDAPHGKYIFKDFKQGIGKLKQGNPICDNFNYDIVKEEMHFLDGNDEMKLEMPELDSLFFDKRVFVQRNGKFAECFNLDNGVNLQVYWHAKQVEKGKEGAMGISTQAGGVYNIMVGDYTEEHAYQDREYKDIATYNYIPQNTYIATVKGKSKKFKDADSFAKVFNIDKETVKETMKKNSWNFHNLKDVIALLNSMEFK